MRTKQMPKKNGKDSGVHGPFHKVDYAIKENAELSKEQIREWLMKDMKGAYIVLAEIINSQECYDALVEVMWNRYLRMHKEKQIAPELPLDQPQQ